MRDLRARVLANRAISESFWLLRLEARALGAIAPGQFVQVLCRRPQESDPFLRRPFSVLDRRGDAIELLYKIIGPGTERMSAFDAGQPVSLLGPLGRGFTLPEDERPSLIVAGGTGLGGVGFLARRLAELGRPSRLLYGVRRENELPWAVLDQLEIPVDTIAEDRGGRVTTLIDKLDLSRFGRAYVCGPTPMMRAVGEQLRGAVPWVELSLEEMMGCGFGICYVCPVRKRGAEDYYSACVDGPVFRDDRVILA